MHCTNADILDVLKDVEEIYTRNLNKKTDRLNRGDQSKLRPTNKKKLRKRRKKRKRDNYSHELTV
jgi:hypothetical protein